MNINSDINVLGGLPDFELVNVFFRSSVMNNKIAEETGSYTKIKTIKSIKRFERAILSTLLFSCNPNVQALLSSFIKEEGISDEIKLLLFWNASYNNELLNYLNESVYFPAFYSGRIAIRLEEGVACLKELRQSEPQIQKWSESTINRTASKYMTFLKKINLMEGSVSKSIMHPLLSDKMLLAFVYWILAVEPKSNLLESKWLKYSFFEKEAFIESIMQKRFFKFIHLSYTGEKLTVEPIMQYKELYNAIIQS